MVYLVVQWDGEDSVSIVREGQLAHNGSNNDIKEGMIVQVLFGKNPKGRSILYKATVLKVFGKCI